VTTLDVRRWEPRPGHTQYSYTLRTSDELAAGPLEQEYTVDVNQALVKASCAEIDDALENATAAPNRLREVLRTQSRLLYKQLLQPPEGSVLELVKRLQESTEPLVVRTNESLVPWELLHDGENFLGLAADLGRRAVVANRVVGGRDIGPVRRALVVGDTLGDLPRAREEVERISGWLSDQGIECTVLTGAEATLGRVIRELADEDTPHDLFHFSGHVSSAPDAAGLLVHRRDLIDEPALRTLAGRGGPPVVFINGCASAGLTMSVCRSFMLMGAKTVVGTRAVVADTSAQHFAETFYQQLRQGLPAGAAVREARLVLTGQADDSWAAFVLYGDPGTRITSAVNQVSSPEPLAPDPRFTPDAVELMGRVQAAAAARGLVTSIDLLAGLLETEQIQERSLPRIGHRRLALLREALDRLQGGAPALAQANGHHRGVELSDTVTRVIALADEAVAAAGRRTVSVDDIAAALLKVGGSACADLLDLCGISMDQLLAPDQPAQSGQPAQAAQPSWGVERTARDREAGVPLDAFAPRAAGVIQCARLLAAVSREPVSTYLLLKAFALTGSEALHQALDGLGAERERALRRLGGISEPHSAEFSRRVLSTLDAVTARAPGAEPGRAGEAELLLALITDPDSSAGKALRRLGIDPEQVIRNLSG
jgi:hypothetical protein